MNELIKDRLNHHKNELNELRREIRDAWSIVGNQPRWALVNMIRALEMCSVLNSEEEDARLAAAKIAVKHPNPRYT